MTLAQLTVNAGWHNRFGCPVQATVSLEDEVDLDKLVLFDATDGTMVPVQAWRNEAGEVELAWVVAKMVPEESRVFQLQTAEGGSDALTAGVKLEEKGEGKLQVDIGGSHFTTYNFGRDWVRPFLYPVMADEGVGVTRNWPMVEGVAGETSDHPHHKGIYTAVGDVNGTNNWSEGPGHAWQNHQAFSRTYSGPVAGGFTAQLDWTDQDRETVVMTETRRLAFYNTPRDARLFDYDVTFHASEGKVILADSDQGGKEGGILAARVASSMDAGREFGGIIENGMGGVQEPETWGKRAPWCDYSGPVGDDWYGICLMDHMENPRHPTYWHVRNYGLMTANPIGLHHFTGNPDNRWDLTIPAGKSVTFRYRVLIHHGDTTLGNCGVHYQGFVNPPTVDVRMPRR
jgi:hypothetical protein